MFEAVRAVLRHCFTAIDMHRVEVTIEPKLGFVRESRLLRDCFCVNGNFRSVLMYGLIKLDWHDAK